MERFTGGLTLNKTYVLLSWVGTCSAVSAPQVEMEEKRNLPVWGPRKRERKREGEIDAARDNCFPHSESQ